MSKSTKLILAAIAAGLSAFFVISMMSGDKSNSNEMDLEAAVDGVNSQCPMVVDATSRLDSASHYTNYQMTYFYTIHSVSFRDIDLPQFQTLMQTKMQEKYDSAAEFDLFRKSNVAIAYDYKDKDGKFLAYFVCDSKKNKP